jgi:hypothetical protein
LIPSRWRMEMCSPLSIQLPENECPKSEESVRKR